MADNKAITPDSVIDRPNGRDENGRFLPGHVSNPKGGPKLTPYLKGLLESSLSRAVDIMYDMLHDRDLLSKMSNKDKIRLIEIVFDRCGLPKAQINLVAESLSDDQRKITVQWVPAKSDDKGSASNT